MRQCVNLGGNEQDVKRSVTGFRGIPFLRGNLSHIVYLQINLLYIILIIIKSENAFSHSGKRVFRITEARKVRVLERAFDIIECFSTRDPELTLVEICKRTGLSLATVHRSIQTMISRGYVQQDANTGKYHLGMQFVELSGIVVGRMDLIRISTPFLEELSRQTEQNANLSVYDKAQAMCLVNIESFQSFFTGIKVGQRLPIYAGALSKVILAFLPQQEIDSVLSGGLSAFTPRTIAQAEKLLVELEHIRARGYSTSRGEFSTGEAALAAPIFDYTEKAVGGISISGPEHFYTDETLVIYQKHLLNTASSISSNLGYLATK